MRQFLGGWPTYKGRSTLDLYRHIQADAQIRDICRNPLLLTILTGLYLENDNFEMPSSRERFYSEAVDELLIKRPARKAIKQSFESADKRKILEAISLARLEDKRPDIDPEEFDLADLKAQAVTVMDGNVNMHDFARELVEINGIVKPSRADAFTFSHRTIQEYFAAVEALRSRSGSEILDAFLNRSEMSEVLYFYCGVLQNRPELNRFLDKLLQLGRVDIAARCAVSASLVPKQKLIDRIVEDLCTCVHDVGTLDLLVSLANRREKEYTIAKARVGEAVERVVEYHSWRYSRREDSRELAELRMTLSARPELAMQLIPQFLASESGLRQIGVELLRNINRAEALNQLVALLDKEDYREQAARVIVPMLKTRREDLRKRAGLLPFRRDTTIWPLERYFPGSIALPMVESLVEEETGRDLPQAIKAALWAAKNKGEQRSENWRRVMTAHWALIGSRLLGMLIFFGALIISVFAIVSTAGEFIHNHLIVSPTWPFIHVSTVDVRHASPTLFKTPFPDPTRYSKVIARAANSAYYLIVSQSPLVVVGMLSAACIALTIAGYRVWRHQLRMDKQDRPYQFTADMIDRCAWHVGAGALVASLTLFAGPFAIFQALTFEMLVMVYLASREYPKHNRHVNIVSEFAIDAPFRPRALWRILTAPLRSGSAHFYDDYY